MDLEVHKDNVSAKEVNNSGVPAIDTRNVRTQVLVDNGETVVLGGVFSEEKRNKEQRIPFFADLPYVGNLFRNTSKKHTKQELLIFVTPKILKDSLTVR
jgi:type IV pilus assembly protein PilQ